MEARLVRFGVSMHENLLQQFDTLLSRKGYANRSEAVRDLIRDHLVDCLLYTSPSPRDRQKSRMPSSA